MAEGRNANLFEVVIGQVTQNAEINIILSKALNMLLHTELFEPVRNLLHRGHVEYLSLASTSQDGASGGREDFSQSRECTHVRLGFNN